MFVLLGWSDFVDCFVVAVVLAYLVAPFFLINSVLLVLVLPVTPTALRNAVDSRELREALGEVLVVCFSHDNLNLSPEQMPPHRKAHCFGEDRGTSKICVDEWHGFGPALGMRLGATHGQRWPAFRTPSPKQDDTETLFSRLGIGRHAVLLVKTGA